MGENAAWHSDGTLVQQMLRSATICRDGCCNGVSAPSRVLLHDFTHQRSEGIVTVSGRVECGSVSPGLVCQMAPSQYSCTVQAVIVNDQHVPSANVGESLRLRLTGLSTTQASSISEGAVLSCGHSPVHGFTEFT